MSVESCQLHLSSTNADSNNNDLTSDCNFYLPVIEIPSNYHIYLSNYHIEIHTKFYKSTYILQYKVTRIT